MALKSHLYTNFDYLIGIEHLFLHSILTVILFVHLYSRGSDECNKKQPSDCDTLEYRNGEGKLYNYSLKS